MKVLWITFNYFPELCESQNLKEGVTGSWVYRYAKKLLEVNPEICMAVASPYEGKELKSIEIKNTLYYLIPAKKFKKYNSNLEPIWRLIYNDFKPQVIHIHGSEYPIGLSYVRACGPKGVVLSMQGLVSVIERYYYGGLSQWSLLLNMTFRDIIRRDSVFHQKRDIKRRGKYEVELIQRINNVIGRTEWDEAHAWVMNPSVNYHFCDEPLRESFYKNKWCYEDCDRYSIFISQGQYPLKGLHMLIEALPTIINNYPQTKVFVSGSDIVNNRGLRITGYGNYIKRKLKKYSLEDVLFFTGPLSELEIVKRLLKSNVAICPSSIENGSISNSEAQIMGVPTIVAQVGGLTSRVKHKTNGLTYRFEEPEILAWQVCNLFSNIDLTMKVSKEAQGPVEFRQGEFETASVLNGIYAKICKSTNS